MTLSQDLKEKNETPVKFEKTELTYAANVYLFWFTNDNQNIRLSNKNATPSNISQSQTVN